MSLTVSCPFCGKNLQAPESAVGKKAKCPACSGTFVIEEPIHDAEEVGHEYSIADAPSRASEGGFGDLLDQLDTGPRVGPPAFASEPAAAASASDADRRPCPMCGEMIVRTAMKCRFCGEVFDPELRRHGSFGGGSYAGTSPLPYTEQGFHSLYLWFAILLGVGIPAVFVIIGFFMLIAAVVLQFILLYRCWAVIQDGNARTTPGAAVGLMFVPFFNLYWMFVALHGLAKDMNRYCRQHSLRASVSPDLVMTYCILTLCGIVPYLGILAALINLILLFIVWHQFTQTAATIVRYRNHPRAAY